MGQSGHREIARLDHAKGRRLEDRGIEAPQVAG